MCVFFLSGVSIKVSFVLCIFIGYCKFGCQYQCNRWKRVPVTHAISAVLALVVSVNNSVNTMMLTLSVQ